MAIEDITSSTTVETAGPTGSAPEKTVHEVHEDSEILLQKIKEKYRRKQERLEELKEQEKKMRAAMVFTRRRAREVSSALAKGGNMVSDAVLAAQKESIKLLDRARAQTRIFSLNQKVEQMLAQLGSEIYDLVDLGTGDIFENANVKKVLSRINECNVEIELINKKFAAAAKGPEKPAENSDSAPETEGE